MAGIATLLTIHERDIASEVCRRCARCCRIEIKVAGTDSRYRRFLREVGMSVSPGEAERKGDCCDQVHEITLDLGPCAHLRSEQTDGETLYSCGLWDDGRRPQLCEEYNCVSWAKAVNSYNLGNAMVAAAQATWSGLSSGERSTSEVRHV